MHIAQYNQRVKQAGLTYLAVLFLVAAIAVSMAVVAQSEDMRLKREKEQDWLYAGKQYERAIASYYQQSPNGLKTLPASIDDLLSDKRFIAPTHHLRKAYLDPLTNKPWVLLVNDENQLLGVVSTLQQPILSTKIVREFQASQADIIAQYSDVKFEFKSESKTEFKTGKTPSSNADEEPVSDASSDASNESETLDDVNNTNIFAQE